MNWDAVGAGAELLGSVGVILTVFYLIVQIKQNTSSLEANSQHSLMSDFKRVSEYMRDRDLTETILQGLEDPGQLDPIDQARFATYVTEVCSFHADAFYQFRSGHFPAEMWNAYERDIVSYQLNPGFRATWQIQRTGWPEVFVDHVENLLASHDSDELPNYFST